MRETLRLTDDAPWRFLLDPVRDGEKFAYHTVGCDDRDWRETTLPRGVELCGPALDFYVGPAWFRRRFTPPATWQGQRVQLHFAGVNYHCRVWVNGAAAGGSDCGFLPFALNISALLKPGIENQLTLCVDAEERPEELPGPRLGWRSYSGVLREAWIECLPSEHIAEIAVTAEPDGTIAATVTVNAAAESTPALTVVATVRDRQGHTLATLSPEATAARGGAVPGNGSQAAPPPEAGVVQLTGTVPGITPWTPDAPVLYELQVQLRRGDTRLDEQRVRCGFRRLEKRGTQLLLNGQPLYLTGFNRHEDSPRTGMATDLDTARRDLEQMKAAGCNFVRLCHYPHHSGELDLCDELGLLAMAEIPLYWWAGETEGLGLSARRLANAREMLQRLIRRDRNHPSIIFWSVSNETMEREPGVVAGNTELLHLARQLDPTRLAVHVAHQWCVEKHFEADDVICLNAYPLAFPPENWAPPPDLKERLRGAEAWWRQELEIVHGLYPDKPILISEFGYPCIEGERAGPWGDAFAARALLAETAGMTAPYVCGLCNWCYADHSWPARNFHGGVVVSPFGVVTRNRQPKAALAAVQEAFIRWRRTRPP